MEVVAVIPARISSTRFPGKVLKHLGGKSILAYVYERVRSAKMIQDVYIATADAEIIKEAEFIGAKWIKTEKEHSSGTSRVAEAASKIKASIYINVQADEPLISPDLLNELALKMLQDNKIEILTALGEIKNKSEAENPNVVKVVWDKDFNALYFSRSVIPYGTDTFFKHIGIYCFREEFLHNYPFLEKSPLEEKEKLEQLSFLWNGYKIKVHLTEYENISIDTPEDLEKVKRILKV